MPKPKQLLKLIVALSILSVAAARASDLFQVDVVSGTSRIDVGGNTLIDLTQQLINNTGQFSSLQGQSYTAALNYGGVPNALNFAVTQGVQYTAKLTTPFDPGLINRTFTGTSQSDLYNQIKDYLKSSGSSDFAKFLAAIGKDSPAGVVDGNPHASTANSANVSFFQYAFAPTQTQEESDAPESSGNTSSTGLAFTADGGQFSSKVNGTKITGDNYSFSPMMPFRLADRVRLEVTLPLDYTKIEGANEFGIGLQLALPVLVVKHTKDNPWTWQLTPSGGALASGSEELVAGGVLGDGALASYTSYRWNKWEFGMGNAFSFYRGIKITVGGYSFDPDVSQEIVKNGLKVGRQLGKHWYAELYAIDTEFIEAAYTPRYTTLGGGVGYRGSKKKGFLMIGGYTDLAPGYSAAKLQFGTGWKF